MLKLLDKDGEQNLPDKVRVAICIPTRGSCPTGFTHDLANMMAWSTASMVSAGVLEIRLIFVAGTYVHDSRNSLVDMSFTDPDTDFILWLDDDMRFPKDLLYRLLNHKEDIVGVNYSTRRLPPQPVAIKHIPYGEGEERGFLFTEADSTGLEEVDAIGFGAVLIARDVFTTVKPPWFLIWYDESQGNRQVGEDVHFCIEARKVGYKIYVDHDLSKEVRHCGEFEFKLEDTIIQRGIDSGPDELHDAASSDSELAEPVGSDSADT